MSVQTLVYFVPIIDMCKTGATEAGRSMCFLECSKGNLAIVDNGLLHVYMIITRSCETGNSSWHGLSGTRQEKKMVFADMKF